jgi:His/Glu/Gln/Arg/opine family amino acid ABC transporter permease subunit
MNFDLDFVMSVFGGILEKLPVNLGLALVSFVFGILLALLINVVRFYEIGILNLLMDLYISLARGIPIYLQIVLAFFGLPILFRAIAQALGGDFNPRQLAPELSVVVALTFVIASYLSEAIRGGIAGVTRGELEAGYSIGMSRMQLLRRIVLPRAAVLCLPNFCVLIIGLTHSTTLAFGATVIEMNGQAMLLADGNGLFFEAFLAAGLFFWAMATVIKISFRVLERKTQNRLKTF